MKLRNGVAAVVALCTGAALFVGLAGCTPVGDAYKVAPVRGTVTANGEPVKGGSILFRPTTNVAGESGVSGKPASGMVGDDGTFVLSTYGDNDGAVVGKHAVAYTPFSKGAETYDDKPEPSPYLGMVPKEKEVEIKPGQNDITVELVKP